MKTEYMSFPPPLQRSPLNTATERGSAHRFNWTHQPIDSSEPSLQGSYFFSLDRPAGCSNRMATNRSLRRSLPRPRRPSPRSAPTRLSTLTGARRRASAACPTPPTPRPSQRPTRAGARPPPRPTWPPAARLPARAAAGGTKARTGTVKVLKSSLLAVERQVCGYIVKTIIRTPFFCLQGHESDSASSAADFPQERAPLPRQKDQNKSLLDKLTQEKLDSKAKLGNKRNDLSSGASGRPPSQSVLPLHLLCLHSSFHSAASLITLTSCPVHAVPLYTFIIDIYFLHLFSHTRVSRSQRMLGEHPSSLTELHAQKRQVNLTASRPGSLLHSPPCMCLS